MSYVHVFQFFNNRSTTVSVTNSFNAHLVFFVKTVRTNKFLISIDNISSL